MSSPIPGKPVGDAIGVSDSQAMRTTCEVDGKTIQVMSFKGTGVCGEYCRKVRDGEIVDDRGAE